MGGVGGAGGGEGGFARTGSEGTVGGTGGLPWGAELTGGEGLSSEGLPLETRRAAGVESAVLMPEAGVSAARREGAEVHRVVTAVDGVVGGGGRGVVRERVRCEIRSERGIGRTGETALASVTTWAEYSWR